MIAEPTILELIDISGKAIHGSADKTADFTRGSDYEALMGPTAILWSRESARDTDLFNAVNFNTADGDDLTVMALNRYGKERILDARGTGIAMLVRTEGSTALTVWKGTRLRVPGTRAKYYRTTADTPVATTDTAVVVPIESVDAGPGCAVDVVDYGVAKLEDIIGDSWVVQSLRCADGTRFEDADVFRARIRKERLDDRVGQTKAIIKTCVAAGAANVSLFRSDYAGDAYDHGLNVVYVGDLGNIGSPELVKACTLALNRVRVAGDHMQVLPMARVELAVTADIYLNASPALFDLTRLERINESSIRQYLNGASGVFTYSLDGIRGAIAVHAPDVRRVVFTTPTADTTVVEGSLKNFPAVLNRYVPGRIVLRYLAD